MKTFNIKSLTTIAFIAFLIASCKQEVITLTPPENPTPETPTGSKGNADFSKYVAIGNSLTAGFQAGALFTEGQQNSFPLILSKQMSIAQGTTLTFNQPDINSVNGYNSSFSSPPTVVRGRLVLFAADGVQAHAVPTPAGATGVPAPYNTAGPSFIDPAFYAITFDKTKLNNFGVPGILLGQCLTPLTGGPASSNPAYNPYYARFASNPGTSTIIGDALAAQPTFFTFDLGNNDVLGYATTGGSGAISLTSHSNFLAQYTGAIQLLMTSSNAKGVVSTIPNVTTIPFFYTIKWNAIPFTSSAEDAAKLAQLNGLTGYGGFNAALDGLAQAGAITQAEANKRKIKFSVGSNGFVIIDKDLINLSTALGSINAALAGLGQARQTNANDLVTLTAGGYLGVNLGTTTSPIINGVSVPLINTTSDATKALKGDDLVLIPSETTAILTATADFNSIINSVVANYSTRIAVADVNAAFTSFVSQQIIGADGVYITPTFSPPTGAFSEDGVHPNSRGYAYLANIFIDAINAKFSATVPHASLAEHTGVGLPLGPAH
jgi:lysophospholipase L1-like esterase